MPVLRSNFLSRGGCHCGTEGRPSRAAQAVGPNRPGRRGTPLLLRGRVPDAPPFLPFQVVEAMRRSAEKGVEVTPHPSRRAAGRSARGEPPSPRGEGNDAWGRGSAGLSYLLPRGEGGPRWAFSPAVAGRLRVLFSSGPPPTNNIPSSFPTRSPIFEAGECRGHSEGAKREDETLVSCSRHLSLVTLFVSGHRFA